MREMVLNHASVSAPCSNPVEISAWLGDLAAGMKQLLGAGLVRKSLRTARNLYDMQCLPDYSLFDAYLELRHCGHREELRLFMGLHDKQQPLLIEIGRDMEDRFLACEEQTLPVPDGEPLVLCAIADWIAIGFPSEPVWDRDHITVRFNELLPDETIKEASEEIDQLTRSAHAGPICNRHRERLLAGSGPVTLWENRQTVFPNLVFGPGVESNLKGQAHLFPTIVGKLKDLDQSAREWLDIEDPAPPWKTKVTPESTLKMKNRFFREARMFQSHLGTREIFERHARFGWSGRIHLRFDPATKEVEIGYIGPHLPL